MATPSPPRTFEKFYLLTVPHGRKGAIPYEYPATAPADAPKVRPSDIINFCFPDLEELRKTRSLDFRAPTSAPATSTLGTLGAQVSGVVGGGTGPSAPPTLVISGSSNYSTASSPGVRSTTSTLGSGANTNNSFRAEFYTFALTEANGSRVFGMVYRCLPTGFGMRYDVGKRFPECLCVLTRHPQAQPLFQQVLQQVHSLRLMFAPIGRIEALLGELYNRPLPSAGETILLKQQPVGTEHAARSYRYTWPAEGEVPANDALATLYLFQQLKPKAFVILLSAMLCERRICFVASEMDKLMSCVHAAVGLLYPFSWQHAFIPVLPASLLNYAAAPVPIIFGLRRHQLPLLNQLPSEDLITVDLDAGELSWSGEGPCPVPDIYVLPNTSQVVQAAQKLGAEAAKAAEKLDKAFNKGVAFLQRYTGQQPSKEAEEPKPDAANVLAWELSLMGQTRASNPIAWGTKGKSSKNEKSILADEQQLRDALLIFFVSLVGDWSAYLRPDRTGKLVLDRDFYIGSRGMLGDGPHLSNFLLELVQSQLFERLAESRKAQASAELNRIASPRGGGGGEGTTGPFFRCVEAVKARGETFSVSNIKKVLKAQQQVGATVASQPGQPAETEQTSGRWTVFHETALQLTSSSGGPVQADAQRALHILVEDAYSSTLLPSILRVVWNRLGDCKGLKWKHAHKSLLLLRELLIRGPESVLSETLSNITVLRTFLEYKAGVLGGGGQGNKVREVAHDLFFVLLDGRQFMLQRSVYWTGKKKLAGPALRLNMEHALSTAFADLHQVVAPTSEAPVVPASASLSTSLGRSGGPPPDLLSAESTSGDDQLMPLTDVSAFAAAEPEEGEGDQQQQQQQQQPALLHHHSSSTLADTRNATPVSAQPSMASPLPPPPPPPAVSTAVAPSWEAFPSTYAADQTAAKALVVTGQFPSDALPPIQPILSPTAATAMGAPAVPAYGQPYGTTGAGARILSPSSMGGGVGGGGVMQAPAASAYDPFADFAEIENEKMP